MKMPANFAPYYYKLLKKEAERIAQSFIVQLGIGALPFSEIIWQKSRMLSEKINADVVRQMIGDDFEVLLNFFVCPYVYIATRKDKPGYFVFVSSVNCANGILRTVSKVHPKRVNK